jgi:hypothetical protein
MTAGRVCRTRCSRTKQSFYSGSLGHRAGGRAVALFPGEYYGPRSINREHLTHQSARLLHLAASGDVR